MYYLLQPGEHTPWGTIPYLPQEKATGKNVQNLGLCSVIFEEELWKQGFALDWMLSGIVDNSVIKFLKFDTEGETRVRMKLWLVERHSLA